MVNPCNQAIWQRKTPPDIQGRVFSVRLLIAQIAGPLGQLLAGPLADRVVEPAMKPGGALAHALGGIFGTGAGSGMALLRAVRDVETIVPDHDALPAAAAGLP